MSQLKEKSNQEIKVKALIRKSKFKEAQNVYTSDAELSNQWLDKYKKNIWVKLSTKNKKKLCKRFDLPYRKEDTITSILNQLHIPILPLSFTIASAKVAKLKDDTLAQSNPYIQFSMNKITYDKDKWGIVRTNRPFYGIFKALSIPIEKQKYFETLFISSVSLDTDEKKNVLNASSTLSMFQVNELIKVFENEKTKFGLEWIAHKNDIRRLVKKAEHEWDELEADIHIHTNLPKKDKSKMLDSKKSMTPLAITTHLKTEIKGQDEAIAKISSLLYYQHRLHRDYTHKKKSQFEPLDPILFSGSTGSGKTFLIKRACSILGLPVLHVDASSLVSAGIRGYCINDVMKDILRKTNKQVKRAETAVVVFDEVDKLLHHHDGDSIMHQLLQVVEGTTITLDKTNAEEREFSRVTSLSTHKMLFIFAGSFQNFIEEKSTQSGFIQSHSSTNETLSISDIEKTNLPKELLGRINDIVVLNKLSRENYREILLESKHSPIKKYQKQLAINGATYELSESQIEEILDKAEKSSYGARSLNQIVKPYFDQILYDAPSL